MGSHDTAAGYPPVPRTGETGFAPGYPSVQAPSNAYQLLLAGFFAILAAGVGFAIRGGILANWGSEYGFTAEELGRIAGGGFTGFFAMKLRN